MPHFIPPLPSDDSPSFTARGPVPAPSLAIKQWTRDTLRLDDDAIITVIELTCTDPDCPGIETIIAVFDPAGRRQWKLTGPKAAVTEIMVQQALAIPPHAGLHAGLARVDRPTPTPQPPLTLPDPPAFDPPAFGRTAQLTNKNTIP
jgi:hypothetical protein